MKLFLAPHNDDETLFGAFTILREKPLVVIVTDSFVQFNRGTGIHPYQRRDETASAMEILGDVRLQFLHEPDNSPTWGNVALACRMHWDNVEHVFAPAIEEGGHPHHNRIGQIADEVFGSKVTHYMTYTTAGKSRGLWSPFEKDWPLLKLKALACYESQILEPSTRDHFLREQYEYYQS